MGLKIQRRVTTKARVITTLIAVFALIAQPGYSFVAGQVANAASGIINVCPVATTDCTHTTIQSAIDDATAGDTVTIKAGTYNLTSSVNIDKSLTIAGEPNAVITADNINHAFNLNADGITVKGLVFTSFSKMTNDGYLYVHTKDVTIQGNIFAGQYSLGDAQVVRGIIVGPNSATNLTIKNNYFHSVRQPAYIDNGTTGAISNNFAQGTKGWVVGADSNLAFTGNSWGTTTTANSGNQKNAVDIAIIKNASTQDNYSDIMALSHANNNAAIDNQYEGTLSTAYVDANASVGGNGYWNSPFQTMQDAINAVSVGGTIELNSDITVNNQMTVAKALTINGNGHTIFSTRNNAVKDTSNNSVLSIQSNGVTVNGLTVDGNAGVYLHGINVFGSSNVQLNQVTAQNNSNAGININASQVTVADVTTAHNGWYGIDVDKAGASLTVNGTSHHTEANADIYIDDTNKVAAITDNSHQYSSKHIGLSAHDLMYKLTLAAPTGPSPTGFINTNDFWFTWSRVANAVSYEWQGSQSDATNPDGTLQNVTWTGDYQKVQPTNPTAHSVGASGTWYWQVRAIDAFGLKGVWSPVWSITVDMKAPDKPSNLTLVGSDTKNMQNNGFTNVQKGTLSWKTTTPADVNHYVYKFWTNISGYHEGVNNAWTTTDYMTKTATGGSIPTDFGNNGTNNDGTYFFCVEAVDEAGNNSGCSDTLAITYDATAPVAQITNPSNQIVSGKTITVNGTATDTNFNYFYCYVTLPGSSEVGTRGADCNTTWHAVSTGTLGTVNVTGLADGNYEMHLVAYDKAGNHSDLNYAVPFTLDNTKPAVSFTSPTPAAGSYITANSLTIGYSAHDNIALKSVNVSLFDTDASHSNHWAANCYASSALTGVDDSGTCVINLPANLPDGQYYVQVGAQDQALNWSVNATRTINIDRTAPTAVVTYSNNNGNAVTNQDVTVTLTASEPLQTLAGWAGSGTSFTKSYADNGKYSVVLTDLAGHTTTVKYEVKRIDKVAPVINGVTDGTVYNKNVPFTVTEQSIQSFIVDGFPVVYTHVTGWDYTSAPVTGEGNHTIQIIDKGGNSTSVSFKIDTLAPTLAINTPTLNNDGTYTISGTTTDITAPLTLTINNTPVVPITTSATPNADGTWNWSADLGALIAKTLFTLSANSTDGAGNVATTATTSYTTPSVKTVTLTQVPSSSPNSNGPTRGLSIVVPVSTVADPPTVLGTQTAKGSILAASDKVAAIAPSEQGWKIFGVAWYWWVLIVAAVAAIMWWIVAAARRRSENV